MDKEKLQINLAPGQDKVEIIVREVTKVNELEIKAPVKTNLFGVIGTVAEFLSKRMDQPDQVEQKRCHITVNRENISIILYTNENDEYLSGIVAGKLSMSSKFEEFGINTGKVWSPSALGMFFKMNRAFFTDRTENMRLVSELMNFTATVNNNIQKAMKENGDRTDHYEQIVNSNLPKAFTLKIPIFKGCPAETLEVETFAQVSGHEVSFILLSPSANQTMEDIRDNVIDEQIKIIREMCPDIAIIEQ